MGHQTTRSRHDSHHVAGRAFRPVFLQLQERVVHMPYKLFWPLDTGELYGSRDAYRNSSASEFPAGAE